MALFFKYNVLCTFKNYPLCAKFCNTYIEIYYCEQPLSETTMWIKTVYCNQWWAESGCQGFYIKQSERGREQDSGETEREKECDRQSVAGNEG